MQIISIKTIHDAWKEDMYKTYDLIIYHKNLFCMWTIIKHKFPFGHYLKGIIYTILYDLPFPLLLSIYVHKLCVCACVCEGERDRGGEIRE